MNQVIYDNAKIADILAEKNWKLTRAKNPGRTGSSVLVRQLEHKADDFSYDAWQKIVAFHNTWTSAKNYTDDSSAASNLVIDPMVEGRVESGTYGRGPLERERASTERVSQGHWIIRQTLFKGAADTETEYTSESGCRFMVYRKYYVEQVAMPDIAASSSGVETSRNFNVDPVTGLYSGFTERRVQVYQKINEFYTVADAFSKAQIEKHYGLRTDDKDESGNVIAIPDPTAAITGEVVTVDRQKNANCTQDATVATDTAIPKTNAVVAAVKTPFKVDATVQDVNQTTAATVPATRADGTIIKATATFNKYRFYDNQTETDTAIPVPVAVESNTYTALEVTTDVLARNTVVDPTLPSSQTAGKIKRVEDTLNDYGAHDVRTVERTAVPVPSLQVTDSREKFQTLSETRAANASAALTSGTQSAGTVVTDVSTKNEFALFDTSRQTRTAVEVTDASTTESASAYEDRETVIDRNVAAPAAFLAQVAGTIIERQDAINDFAKHDVTETTRTAVPVANSGNSDTKQKYETVAVAEATNATNPLTPGALAAGSIVTAKNKFNDFKLWDTAQEARTSNPVPTSVEEVVHEKYENRSVVLDRNTVADPPLPSSQAVTGSIISKRDTVNDFGVHDVQTETRVANAVPTSVEEVTYSKYESRTEVLDRNTVADPPLPSSQATAGVIVTKSDTVNDFNVHDVKTLTRTAVPVPDAATTDVAAAFENRQTVVDRNVAAPAAFPAQSAGTIIERQDAINEFALHDVTETTRTAVERTSAGAVDIRNAFETVATVEKRNTAAETPGAQTDGTIKTVRNTLNEFLKHDTVVETRTAVGVEDVVQEKVITPFETRTTVRDVHQANDAVALPTTQAQNVIETVAKTKDEFGKSTIEVSTRTATPADSGNGDSKDFYSHTTVAEKKNQTTAVTPSAFSAGSIVLVDNQKNEFDSFDTKVTTRVADAQSQAAFVANIDEYTKITVTSLTNQVNAPSAITAVGEKITVTVNEFQRYDSTKEAETPITGLIGTTHSYQIGARSRWTPTYTKKTLVAPGIYPYGKGIPVTEFTYISVETEYTITDLYTIAYHANEAAAVAAIHTYGANSSYGRIRPGLWQSKRHQVTSSPTGSTVTHSNPYAGLPGYQEAS